MKNNIILFRIQETYLKPYINLSFKDYKIVRLERWNKEKAGVTIHINKDINYIPICLSMQDDYRMEVAVCKLHLKNKVKLNILSDGNLLLSDHGLEKNYRNNAQKEETLILGDLNSHNGLWCGCRIDYRNRKTIFKFLMKTSYICLVTPKDLPTRINSRTGRSVTIGLPIGSTSLAPTVPRRGDKESIL